MGEPLDRRGFLVAGLGAGSAVVLTACGASTKALVKRRAAPPKTTRSVLKTSPQKLSEAIRGPVFTRGAAGFAGAAEVYNQRFDAIVPHAVAQPVDAIDLRDAVRWTVAHDVNVRARSGGHSYAGYSTLSDGVVLDLRKLSSVSVDRGAGTARVGAGAQLIDVYTALAAHGATIPAGSCPSVGVSGVTLGGGMGLAGRAFGLTTDNVVGFEIVTADGTLQQVDATHNPDLFWALRGGGGGNFGVVTQFTFKVHPLPASAAYFFISWPWSEAGDALDAWLNWAPHADRRATSIFHLNAGGGTSVNVTGQYLGPAADLDTLLAPMRALPGASISTGDSAYLPLQMRWAGCLGLSEAACHTVGTFPGGTLARASFDAKSDYLTKRLPPDGLAVLTNAIAARAQSPGTGAILFDSYGGAINEVAPAATAFVHRDTLCAMQYLSYDGDDDWLEQTWSQMRPYVCGQAYQNYIDRSLPDWQQAYYGANYPRLEQIRKTVDPDHYFNFPQAIA